VKKPNKLLLILSTLVLSLSIQASDLTIPNQFTSGSRAVAADVNANFTETATAVNDNQSQLTAVLARLDALEAANAALQTTVTALQTENAALQTDVSNLQAEQVVGLANYVAVDTNLNRVTFSGANVHVNNGMGSTATINGLGNLVVGYDENRVDQTILFCSDGAITNQADCEAAGEVWASVHKSGSHNVVIGPEHNYSRSGGLIAGGFNNVLADSASVTGGFFNTAAGVESSVSGGEFNLASGARSSVSGGLGNTASGFRGSVSGGQSRTAGGATAAPWAAGSLSEGS